MDRRNINTLIVNDEDLECKSNKLSLNDLKLTDLSFNIKDLNEFELIIYEGNKGSKILRSKYFKTGNIK